MVQFSCARRFTTNLLSSPHTHSHHIYNGNYIFITLVYMLWLFFGEQHKLHLKKERPCECNRSHRMATNWTRNRVPQLCVGFVTMYTRHRVSAWVFDILFLFGFQKLNEPNKHFTFFYNNLSVMLNWSLCIWTH